MCDFCKIIERKIDAFIVHETDKNIVFLDYEPINEGHVLIVPKHHAPSIADISSDTLSEINEIIKKIVIIYEQEYGAKGYSIMQNGGEFCQKLKTAQLCCIIMVAIMKMQRPMRNEF